MKTLKEKLAIVKEVLKVEAKELSASKINVKNSQRTGDWSGSCGQWTLLCKRREWRHKFIAYCLLKGRTLEEIEKTCHEDNQPDMDLVERYKREFCGDNDA